MSIPDKMAAGILSLAAVVPSIFTNELTTPIIGVGVSTIAGAALGTFAAIGYDDAVHARGKLFTLAIGTVIISSAMTGVLPAYFGWKWLNGGLEGGVAALGSVICYYTLPEIIPLIRRVARSFKLSDLKELLPFRRGGAATPPNAPPPNGDDAK